MKTLSTVITCFAALMLYGCSCSSEKESGAAAADTTSVAYHEGRNAAQTMIYTCDDSIAVQNFILDFQAHNYQIELNDGRDAARDHRRGFEDALREFDPPMADRIIGSSK